MGEWRGQQFDENARLRERIAVLETNLATLQAAIKSLTEGQAGNRAYTEKSFAEVIQKQNELKAEITDLKIVVASRPIPTVKQTELTRAVIGIGVGIAILVVVLLLLWVQLVRMGVHL